MTGTDLFSWASNTTIAISILIVLVIAIRKPVARWVGPQAAYALWLLPIARFFIPALPVLPAQTAPVVSAQPALFLTPDATASGLRQIDLFRSQIAESASSHIPLVIDSNAFLPDLMIFLWLAIGGLWLAATLCRQALAHKAMMLSTRPAPPEQSAEVTAICADLGLRQKVRVRIGKHDDQKASPIGTDGPLVTGIFRPVIVLPAQFVDNYTANEQHMTLMHECMHVRRGDLKASLIALVFRAVNWPNPLIHFGWKLFRDDQEAACDVSVLRHLKKNIDQTDDKKARSTLVNNEYDYASALVKSARHAVKRRAPQPMRFASDEAIFPSLSHLHTNHHVKERLMLIKNSPIRSRKFEATVAGIALLAGLGLTANYTHAAQNSDKQDKNAQEDQQARVEKRSRSISVSRFGDEDKQFIVETYDFDDDDDGNFFEFESEFEDGFPEHLAEGAHFMVFSDDDESKSKIFEWLEKSDKHDAHGDTIKSLAGHRNFFFQGDSGEVIMKLDSNREPLTITRDGDQVLINGKPVDAQTCRSKKGTETSIILKLKNDGKDEKTEVICQSDGGVFPSGLRSKTHETALRSALESMERNLEKSKEREDREIARLKERQRRVAEGQRSAVERLRKQLEALENAPEAPTPPEPNIPERAPEPPAIIEPTPLLEFRIVPPTPPAPVPNR